MRILFFTYLCCGLTLNAQSFDLKEYSEQQQRALYKSLGVTSVKKQYSRNQGVGISTTYFNEAYQVIKTVFIYEHLGKENWNPVETVTTFEYEGENLVLKEVNEPDEPLLTYTYSYDKSGKLIRRTKLKNGKFSESAHYFYDQQGRQEKAVFQGVTGISEVDSSVFKQDGLEYSYVRMKKGKPYLSSITKLDASGNILFKVMRPVSIENPESGGENVFKYKYDEDGNKTEYLWSSGSHGKISHRRYYYNDGNLCYMEESYRAKSRKWVTKMYKYDAKGYPKSVEIEGEYEERYTYSKNGLIKSLKTKFVNTEDQIRNGEVTYTYTFRE